MKNKLLFVPLVVLTFYLLPFVGVGAANTVTDYKIVSVTQTASDTIVVTVQAHFCPACHPTDRYVEVRIVSSMGYFDLTQRKDTNMDTDWPLSTLVTWDFTFTGLRLEYCNIVTAYATFWCALCDYWYATPSDFHVIPEYPLGTIMGLFACFGAIAVAVLLRSKRYNLSLFK